MWGAALHRGSVRPSHPAVPGSILGVPNCFQIWFILDLLTVALLRESGQRKKRNSWSNPSSLVLVNGKLVLQKTLSPTVLTGPRTKNHFQAFLCYWQSKPQFKPHRWKNAKQTIKNFVAKRFPANLWQDKKWLDKPQPRSHPRSFSLNTEPFFLPKSTSICLQTITKINITYSAAPQAGSGFESSLWTWKNWIWLTTSSIFLMVRTKREHCVFKRK